MERSKELEMTLLGQNVKVRTELTYKEIIQWAQEYVARAVILHPSGVAYWSHLSDAVEDLIIMKALTDMDTSAYETEEGLMEMIDQTMGNAEWFEFMKAASAVRMHIKHMADMLFENLRKIHEKENSLDYKIRESFGFLFTGEDLTETLAHARGANEQMIEHLGAIMKVKELMNGQAKPIDLTMYAKKSK